MKYDLMDMSQEDALAVFHARELGLDLPQAFERDIFLFDCHVAGTSHVEGLLELEDDLSIGDRLTFYREAENPYDSQAIRVETSSGQKLGYVPKKDNPVFARLMDAGKRLFGKISSKETRGDWLKIEMKIYLEDG